MKATLPMRTEVRSWVYEPAIGAETTTTDAVGRAVLMGSLMVAPLIFGGVLVWAWASLAILSAALVVYWTFSRVWHGPLVISWSYLYVPVAAFLSLEAAQFATGYVFDFASGREALIKLTTYVLIFFLGMQLFSGLSSRQWRRFGFSVTIYVALLSLFAILQFASKSESIYWTFRPRFGGWIFGPYVNHDDYAGLMEMLIPLAAACLLGFRLRGAKYVLLIFALLLAIGSALLSGSRGGVAALAVEGCILAGVLIARSGRGARPKALRGVVLTFAAAVLFFLWVDPGHIAQRLSESLYWGENSQLAFSDRWQVTRDTLRLAATHPWFGVGPGSFESAFPKYQTLPINPVWDYAHNDYAQALAESGVVGAVPLVAAILIFLWSAFSHLTDRLDGPEGWMRFGALLGCCGLLIHSFVDFNLRIPANAAWFAICAAIALPFHREIVFFEDAR